MADDLDDLALRAAVMKSIYDRVRASYDDAKEALARVLGPEGRKNATWQAHKIASCSVTKTGRVSITNERLLSEWCALNYPTEVEVRPVIRPAFLDAIRRATVAAGEPCAPDGTLGVPGIAIGDPWASVRAAPGGDEIIAHLWAQGLIDLDTGSVRELESGSS